MEASLVPTPDARPPVGVSACLLGERVRYDGRDKGDDLVREALGDLRLLPVCPEVELGLSVPRPPIWIRAVGGEERLGVVEGGEDLTARMTSFARARWADLEGLGVCGFVLKSRSPSCGLGTTPRHDAKGREIGVTSGLFARVVQERAPDLPLIDEEALRDAGRREAFVDAVRRIHAGRRRFDGEGRRE